MSGDMLTDLKQKFTQYSTHIMLGWLLALTIWIIVLTSTVKTERMSGGPGMWASGGDKMRYMCMDLPGREHCGPGEAFRNKIDRTPRRLRSKFLNDRGVGPDSTIDAEVVNYYSSEVGTGETQTKEYLRDSDLILKLKGK